MITSLTLLFIASQAEARQTLDCLGRRNYDEGRAVPINQFGLDVRVTGGGQNGGFLPPPDYDGEWMTPEPIAEVALAFTVRHNKDCLNFRQYSIGPAFGMAGIGGKAEFVQSTTLAGWLQLGWGIGPMVAYNPNEERLTAMAEIVFPRVEVPIGWYGRWHASLSPVFGLGAQTEDDLLLPATRTGVRLTLGR